MACQVEKDCKRAVETVLRAFDLTWLCARKWRPGSYVAAGTKICARPLSVGGEVGTTGYQYSASGGWTGDEEPQWPTESGGTVPDGSNVWTREDVTADSLERTINAAEDVEWDAESPLTVESPTLNTDGGQVLIAAIHSGGVAGTKRSSWADVTFSDDTTERFEISWKIT